MHGIVRAYSYGGVQVERSKRVEVHFARPSSLMQSEALPQRSPRKRRGVSQNQVDLKRTCSEEAPNPRKSEALPEYRSSAVQNQHFEWGSNLAEALANTGLAMYNYMTPLEGLTVDKALDRTFEAEGHDMQSLVFNFLDELLFVFSTEFFTCKELTVLDIDRTNWKVKASGKGAIFDRQRHESGTEVKAITYSAMQINESKDDAELFVIVDI